MVRYLKRAFGLVNLEVLHSSLFDCTTGEFQDAFDFVLFAGVLYHVTDPILALRITFNCLKDGGKCLLETYALDSTESVMEYQGPGVLGPGSREDLNRGEVRAFTCCSGPNDGRRRLPGRDGQRGHSSPFTGCRHPASAKRHDAQWPVGSVHSVAVPRSNENNQRTRG